MRALLANSCICSAAIALAGWGRCCATPPQPNSTASATPAAPRRTKPTQHRERRRSSRRDAAAKHAKRTACLKSAKAKKLVGAQKTAFIKDCIAAP